jgi:hypothetical protein
MSDNNQRDKQIFMEYLESKSISQLAKENELGYERVRQILIKTSKELGKELPKKSQAFIRRCVPEPNSQHLNARGLPKPLVADFKKKCERLRVTTNWQIMKLIQDWLKGD